LTIRPGGFVGIGPAVTVHALQYAAFLRLNFDDAARSVVAANKSFFAGDDVPPSAVAPSERRGRCVLRFFRADAPFI
jgi:hypothetical protein